jgi:hypothetical protein
MKGRITFGVFALLLLAVMFGMPAAEGQHTNMAASDNPLGFGMRIAGTYFSPAGFGGTLTLNADGTVMAVSGSCCGNAGNVQSEAWGNWVKTGPREIELRTVVIGTLYDYANADPELHGPTGNFIATPSEVLDFAPDYESFTGSLCTSVWFYDIGASMPDVNVDTPAVVLGPFDIAMERLPVFVECP